MAINYVPYEGPIVTRSVAVDAGLNKYFDGVPCKKAGHLSEHRTSSYSCIACEAISWQARVAADPDGREAYLKGWYAKNRDEKLAYSRRRYAENGEQKKVVAKVWRANNRDRLNDKAKREYLLNRDARLAQNKAWAAANRHRKRVHMTTRRARDNAAEGCHTPEDIAALLLCQNKKCAYCRVSIAKSFEVDHITPLSKGGSNWPKNLQLLCRRCNRSKGAADPIDFAKGIGLIL